MSRKIDEDMVYFEKRAVNGRGLFFVILFAILLFGIGGYFVYQNRDKFDWTLPWAKDDDEYEVLGDKTGNSTITKNPSSNKELIVPLLRNEIFKRNQTQIRAYDLTGDDKGYSFKLDYTAESENLTLSIEKILLDGHDTSATLTLSDNVDVGTQQPTTATINIPKTEIDAIDLTCFKNMTIYYRIKGGDKEKELIRIDINAYSPIESDNTIQGLVEFYNGDKVKARYYRTLTDKDYTYIYFDFLNQNKYSKRNLKIKRLLINGKLYDYKDFNEEIYAGTEKIFYISIPRDEIKDVKSFNISFYMMTYDDTNHMISTYVTSEYEKAF